MNKLLKSWRCEIKIVISLVSRPFIYFLTFTVVRATAIQISLLVLYATHWIASCCCARRRLEFWNPKSAKRRCRLDKILECRVKQGSMGFWWRCLQTPAVCAKALKDCRNLEEWKKIALECSMSPSFLWLPTPSDISFPMERPLTSSTVQPFFSPFTECDYKKMHKVNPCLPQGCLNDWMAWGDVIVKSLLCCRSCRQCLLIFVDSNSHVYECCLHSDRNCQLFACNFVLQTSSCNAPSFYLKLWIGSCWNGIE